MVFDMFAIFILLDQSDVLGTAGWTTAFTWVALGTLWGAKLASLGPTLASELNHLEVSQRACEPFAIILSARGPFWGLARSV